MTFSTIIKNRNPRFQVFDERPPLSTRVATRRALICRITEDTGVNFQVERAILPLTTVTGNAAFTVGTQSVTFNQAGTVHIHACISVENFTFNEFRYGIILILTLDGVDIYRIEDIYLRGFETTADDTFSMHYTTLVTPGQVLQFECVQVNDNQNQNRDVRAANSIISMHY